jgi:hypothetical protein
MALGAFRLPALAALIAQLPKHDSAVKIKRKWRNQLGYKHLALYVIANRMALGFEIGTSCALAAELTVIPLKGNQRKEAIEGGKPTFKNASPAQCEKWWREYNKMGCHSEFDMIVATERLSHSLLSGIEDKAREFIQTWPGGKGKARMTAIHFRDHVNDVLLANMLAAEKADDNWHSKTGGLRKQGEGITEKCATLWLHKLGYTPFTTKGS